MATYVYHCLACSHEFQRAETMTAHAGSHPVCPKCRSEKVEQILTPFFARTERKS